MRHVLCAYSRDVSRSAPRARCRQADANLVEGHPIYVYFYCRLRISVPKNQNNNHREAAARRGV